MSPTIDPADVTVCVPWRPQPDRIAAYNRCMAYWKQQGFIVVEADSLPHRPFVCNEARNNAVEKAETDLIIIADADTLPDTPDQISAALNAVSGDEPMADIVWPFTLYRYIATEHVETEDLRYASVVGETYNSPGGLVVTTRKVFWDKLNGYDERFIPGASGFDDTAFFLAAQALVKVMRIYGTVWSFDHPMSVERKYDENNPNYPRYKLYELAKDSPALMAELVR